MMRLQHNTQQLATPLMVIFYSVLGSPASYAHPGHQGSHLLLQGSLLSIIVLSIIVLSIIVPCAVGLLLYRAKAHRAAVRENQ